MQGNSNPDMQLCCACIWAHSVIMDILHATVVSVKSGPDCCYMLFLGIKMASGDSPCSEAASLHYEFVSFSCCCVMSWAKPLI